MVKVSKQLHTNRHKPCKHAHHARVMVPGLAEEEAAELDRKLQLLDTVLEKEVGELPIVPRSLSPRPNTVPDGVLDQD